MHTCVVIIVALFIKALENGSCRSLVNVLRRDLKATFTIATADVVLVVDRVVVVVVVVVVAIADTVDTADPVVDTADSVVDTTDSVVDTADSVVPGTGPAVKIF